MNNEQKSFSLCVSPRALLLVDPVVGAGETDDDQTFQSGSSSHIAAHNHGSPSVIFEGQITAESHESPLNVLGAAVIDVKRARFGPSDPTKATELRRKGVCFKCKVSKATGGVCIASLHVMANRMEQHAHFD